MSQYTHLPSKDYRKESWTLTGSGVTSLFSAWNNDDDSKYASCPSSKGRAAVTFPTGLSSLPAGSAVTSVTIYVRAAKMDSASRSMTLNLISTENTSFFTTRSIFLSETIETYEVSTFAVDALNKPWTISRLDKMIAQIFVNGTTAGKVRIYKLYAVVNYHTPPTATVLAPTGTQVTASPTIRWVYSQVDGDTQGKAEYKIFTAEEVAKSTFNADVSTSIISGETQGDQTEVSISDSLIRGTYYAYVRTYSIFGTKSDWGGRQFQVQPQLPGPPLLTATPDNDNSNIILGLTNGTNLMSLQQSGMENTTDQAEYSLSNCTITRNTSQYYGEGSASYALTASSAATMAITSSYLPVADDVAITVRAQVKTAVTGRTVNATLDFFDEFYDSIGTPLTVNVTDSTSAWKELLVTGTTPVESMFMRLEIEVVSPANAEVHYLDGVGIMYGTDTKWSVGGHFSRNLLSADYSAHPKAADWTAATGTTLSNRTSGVTEIGADSPNAMRMTVASIATSIAYVATGTVYTSATGGTSFTLNKPGGSLAAGHLMVAVLTASFGGTVTAPAGWTLVNATSDISGTGLWILSKVVEVGDPSSWVATVDVSSAARRAVVVGYSGVDTTTPFISENVKSYAGSPFTVSSQTLSNTDPNSWAISAFSGRNSASGSWSSGTTGQPGSQEDISYVGAATVWCEVWSKTSFRINRPKNIKSGDLMIATIGMWGTVTGISTPSGWTHKRTTISGGTFPTTMVVFTRVAGGSEPAYWSGTTNHEAAGTRVTTCVAYRGCDNSVQFIDETSNYSTGHFDDNRKVTGTATNTDGRAWRISAWAANAADPGRWRNSNEAVRRSEGSIEFVTGNNAMTVALYDSNGKIPTGNHKRQAYWYNNTTSSSAAVKKYYATAVGWIGILKPSVSTPPAGTSQNERSDGNTGAGAEQIASAVYDSNGVTEVGNTTITATYSSATNPAQKFSSWVGLLNPAVPSTSGSVSASMNGTVDIESIDPEVMEQAGNEVTLTAAFLGSVPGSTFLTLNFYESSQLLARYTGAAGVYTDDRWTQSYATFPIPDGTTDLWAEISSQSLTVGDTVDVDRVGIMLGGKTFWRAGTNETVVHSIWNQPMVEFADDEGVGYGEWKPLYGSLTNPPVYDPLSGQVTYTDYMPIPFTPRQYRALTMTHGLQGDQFKSEYSEPVETVVNPFTWWLKDPTDPENNIPLRVKSDAVEVATTNTATVFQPLGADFPIVLSEGFKADELSLTILCDHDQWVALRDLLRLERTLFLQSNTDSAWWVRCSEGIESATVVTYNQRLDPLREVTVTFTQVQPED